MDLRKSVLVIMASAACSDEWFLRGNKDEPDDSADADADSDADSDSDADTDSDSDADADSDSDADTDTDDLLDCEADWTSFTPDPGEAGLGQCVVQELFCGDVILATTEGGSTVYDYAFWEDEFSLGTLAGNFDALDGPERSYVFRGVPAGGSVVVTVDACMDIWGNWIRYGDTGNGEYCDLDHFNVGGVFDTPISETSRSTTLYNPSSPSGYDFELIIEGLESEVGNYVLTVECSF